MAAEHPTASWQDMQEGNVFYRRQQVYTLHDKLPNLDDYIVAGCRYGGPIGMYLLYTESVYSLHLLAMMRDTSKMIAMGRSVPVFAKNEVRVYSSAGDGLLVFTVSRCFPSTVSARSPLNYFVVESREDCETRLDIQRRIGRT